MRFFGSSLWRPSASTSIWPSQLNFSACARDGAPSSISPSARRSRIIYRSMSRGWRWRRWGRRWRDGTVRKAGIRFCELLEDPVDLRSYAIRKVELEHRPVLGFGRFHLAVTARLVSLQTRLREVPVDDGDRHARAWISGGEPLCRLERGQAPAAISRMNAQ